MVIKGSTKVVGLIGEPVEHSFSPPMHNEAFKTLGLDYVYVPFNVSTNNLKSAIEGGNSLNIQGLNVTIPHKINVINYLKELDPIAELIGAVNTIDFKNLKGYNTDGIGCIRAIEEVTKIKDKNIVVAGAGGAARAIVFYLAKYGAEEVNILNRNLKKAENLANDLLASNLISNVNSSDISEISKFISDADILIDTTPIGMHPNVSDEPIVKAADIHEELVVNDIVYNPNETVLLKEAIKANAKVVYGIKMLLYQGAESFKIWTGREAPIDVMEAKLKETLNLNTILSDKVYMNATVVTRNIDYWYNEITIDKGSKNGIEKGMAVVVPKGLIGQITKVSNYTSTIKLLSNENMSDKISVKIKVGDNYVYGLISAYDAKTNTYTVEGISENVKIEKDADVVTTGMGTIFPSGLIVGKVKEVTTDNFDLSKVVEVKSSVDFNDIDYVTVLKRKSE